MRGIEFARGGCRDFVGKCLFWFPGPWAFSPSFHITGFQPADLSGDWFADLLLDSSAPKARHVTADLSGLKARHVIAWAEASPTSGGPGKRSPQFFQAL